VLTAVIIRGMSTRHNNPENGYIWDILMKYLFVFCEKLGYDGRANGVGSGRDQFNLILLTFAVRKTTHHLVCPRMKIGSLGKFHLR
jgi:hypothetical protein